MIITRYTLSAVGSHVDIAYMAAGQLYKVLAILERKDARVGTFVGYKYAPVIDGPSQIIMNVSNLYLYKQISKQVIRHFHIHIYMKNYQNIFK